MILYFQMISLWNNLPDLLADADSVEVRQEGGVIDLLNGRKEEADLKGLYLLQNNFGL